MLNVRDLTYHYQAETLSFTFSAEAGSVTAILGPSGAGKSTLLSLLCGLLPPAGGAVSFNGDNFTLRPAHERPLSILFQEHNLFSHLSAFDNIALGIRPNLSLDAEDKSKVKEAAEKVGWTLTLSVCQANCPAVRNSGSHWRVALFATDHYCCWTNPFLRSTLHCDGKCLPR